MRTIRRRLSPVIIALLLLAACKDNAVHQAAKALRDTAKTMEAFQNTIVTAHAGGVISESDTRTILEATIAINTSGQRAVALLRLMDNTGNDDTGAVLAILDQVTVDLANLALALRISDEKLRNNIAATIQLAQASLNTAKLILAGRAQ